MVSIFVDKRIVRCLLKFESVVWILTHNFYDITEILFKVALNTITLTPLYRSIYAFRGALNYILRQYQRHPRKIDFQRIKNISQHAFKRVVANVQSLTPVCAKNH